MLEFIREIRRRKANGNKFRPIWQMALITPVWLVAKSSTYLLNWMDDKFNPPDPNFWND